MPRLKQFDVAEFGGGPVGGGPAMPGAPKPPPGGIRPGGPPAAGGPEGAGDREAAPERDLYPKIEDKLKNLQTTLAALEEGKVEVPKAPGRFTQDDQFDAFNPKSGETSEDGREGVVPPAAGVPPGKRKPGSGDKRDEKSDDSEETQPVEHCLVRVVDIDVLPGRTYEYRLAIRMANPNYRRFKEVASPDYAKEKELVSDWSKERIVVRVEPELYYYGVDQMELEGRRSYKGPNWSPRPGQVVLQAHRWVDHVRVSTVDVPVGEWAVAERFGVYRGEYVGRALPVEVPVWQYTKEKFVIASKPLKARRRTAAGVDVDFGYGQTDHTPPEAILVDFEGGSVRQDVVVERKEDGVKTAPVTDSYAHEVVLLNPDGKLMVLEGAQDAQDARRKKRLEDVRHIIDNVKKNKKPTAGGREKDPFDTP
jgi:hypothetical protein